MDDTRFKELHSGDWNLDVYSHIREFIHNRFSDFEMGPNKHPTRIHVSGCLLVLVYYSFSGTYMYFINGKTNNKKYKPGEYLINKVVKKLKEAAEEQFK